jgi:hypothetical protein
MRVWPSAPLGASFRAGRPAVGDFGLTANLFANLTEALGNFLSELRHFLAQVTELLMDLVPQQRLARGDAGLQTCAKCRFHASHIGAKRAQGFGSKDAH